ncbi:hypothetical protein ACP70R_003290 [Stipagrostis hirtigluma subsp. patula]
MTRSQPPVRVLETTASTCTAEAVQRKHVFMIEGHAALLTALVSGEFVRSDTFRVGGHDWSVRYYPNGDGSGKPGYASAHLELMAAAAAPAEARASCELSIVNRRTGKPKRASRTAPRAFFRGDGDDGDDGGHLARTSTFVKRSKLGSSSSYVRGDSLWIECVVTVFKTPPPARRATPPPSGPAARVNLSSRELELVDMVAQGAADRVEEIVEMLLGYRT